MLFVLFTLKAVVNFKWKKDDENVDYIKNENMTHKASRSYQDTIKPWLTQDTVHLTATTQNCIPCFIWMQRSG